MNADETIIRAVEQARDGVDAETAALFGFYARLLRLLQTRKRELDRDADRYFDRERATALLRAGVPQLEFDRLGLEPERFGPWAREVRDLLAERDPELALEAEELDDERAGDLARAFYADGTTGEGPALDAVIANALAPWLETAAEAILPRVPLGQWRQSYCPICAGAADFAALEPGEEERTLLCERCRAEWRVQAGFCVFCGEDDPARLGYYSTPDDSYRIEVCDSCGHYLKMIRREAAPGALLAAERLLTPGLDVMAVEEGYRRPAGWSDES